MLYNLYCYSDNSEEQSRLPIVNINFEKLSLVNLILEYESKTDKVGSGKYVMIVSGYLPEDIKLKTYKIDLDKQECTEINIR